MCGVFNSVNNDNSVSEYASEGGWGGRERCLTISSLPRLMRVDGALVDFVPELPEFVLDGCLEASRTGSR